MVRTSASCSRPKEGNVDTMPRKILHMTDWNHPKHDYKQLLGLSTLLLSPCACSVNTCNAWCKLTQAFAAAISMGTEKEGTLTYNQLPSTCVWKPFSHTFVTLYL